MPAKGPLPPFHQYRDFLDDSTRGALLDWVIANRERFAASKMADGTIDPARRISERLKDMGPFHQPFRDRILERAADIFPRTGTRPFEIDFVELELAAHGDGAHFAPHRDLLTGAGRRPLGGDATGRHERLLSAVYYFYKEPKAFSGGELRLHRFGSDMGPGDYVDVEPEQNSLVVFPSWALHEVLPVSCSSATFPDYRFAVNCWLCKLSEWARPNDG